jgi:hypothetical protein
MKSLGSFWFSVLLSLAVNFISNLETSWLQDSCSNSRHNIQNQKRKKLSSLLYFLESREPFQEVQNRSQSNPAGRKWLIYTICKTKGEWNYHDCFQPIRVYSVGKNQTK